VTANRPRRRLLLPYKHLPLLDPGLARGVLLPPAMTAPRQVLPGTTYLITRRCLQRRFLLRPSRLTNEIVGFLLAVAAKRYRIDVHVFCVLSNHLHLVVTDPEARLPAFVQFLDSLVARAINAALGRWETFWAPNSFSAVALATPDDIVAKSAYVLANPVAAGLVRRARKWPGLWSNPSFIAAEPLVFKRPRHFFRESGSLPEVAELELVAPPAFVDAMTYCNRLQLELEAVEAQSRALAAEKGKGFVGETRVMRVRPTSMPVSREGRWGIKPRVACRDRWKRIEALGRLAAFVEAYRAALRIWRGGRSDVVFPAGTYLARISHGVACAPAG
jgi:putative transposase